MHNTSPLFRFFLIISNTTLDKYYNTIIPRILSFTNLYLGWHRVIIFWNCKIESTYPMSNSIFSRENLHLPYHHLTLPHIPQNWIYSEELTYTFPFSRFVSNLPLRGYYSHITRFLQFSIIAYINLWHIFVEIVKVLPVFVSAANVDASFAVMNTLGNWKDSRKWATDFYWNSLAG